MSKSKPPIDEAVQSSPTVLTMRPINSHKVNLADETLTIEAVGKPGAGGANHRYMITGMNMDKNGDYTGADHEYSAPTMALILFQNGPVPEAGVNGVTPEALIAICIDRLQSFQKGDFACRENALALTNLEQAQHWLHHRTRAREARGVEGTHTI